MKFCVENDLRIFEFHDSEFSFISFDGKNLVVSASRLNIHKDTPQNPSDYDMEITSAQITFKNIRSAIYDLGTTWKTGEAGKSYPTGPSEIFYGQEAVDRILEELQWGIVVYHFEKEENGGYSIGGSGIEPYFEIKFDTDGISVCWDAYKKKAWYELHRQYQYEIVLHTPKGDETVQLWIGCHEEAVYFRGKLQQPPAVSVGCKFDDKQYWGYGSDPLWIDAFADLQSQLPSGVFLKCCLTCRHGNLCPVGNDANEVFCTKDVLITQKSDLYYYTEDDFEREKRTKQYCNLCAVYQPQTDGYYTYNDYLDFTKKASSSGEK